jgi:putative ABC transport system permease protein
MIQQLVIETLLLAIAGGALGLALAAAGIHTFVAHTSLGIPRLEEVQLDGRVLVFLTAVSLACGLLSGVVPAVRMANADPQDSLRAGTHTIAGNGQALRTREILVGAEVAMSAILLFGAGLMTSSLVRLLKIDKGFTTEQAVAVDISLPYPRYKPGPEYARFWERALEQVRSIPGVDSAAFASKLPLTGESMVNTIAVEGSEQAVLDPASRDHVEINVRYVSPDYFRTLGIPLLRGRLIDPHDQPRVVAVVSERLASKVWPHEDPLGKTFITGAAVGKAEVVGIVKDVHTTALDQEPTMIAYVPYWHRAMGAGDLVVRTARDPAALIPEIHRRIQALDPSFPIPATMSLGKLVSESLSRRYFQLRLAAAFASAALLLALMGIYGVVAYNVAQRRTEIAVRLAIGATRTDVLRAVLVRGLRPIVMGLLIGLPCAAAFAQLIRKTLYGVQATDPLTMLSVALLVAATALCACLLGARAALRTDPVSALRYE